MRLFLLIIALFMFTGTVYAAVNINTATQAELETLQGIGPAKAKAIVDIARRMVRLNRRSIWRKFMASGRVS